MGLLQGKVAVITGAGGGLGRAYALRLAQEGAAVVVNDVSVDRDGTPLATAPLAEAVAAEIRAAGGQAIANAADVGDEAGARSILEAAVEAFGGVDILVNNAGILRDRSLAKMSAADWDAVLKVHLRGTFCVTRPIFAHMRDTGRKGVIVNTSSSSGLRGQHGQANYGAAKAGIWGFSNVLTLEGLKHGIRVWTLAPAALTRLTEDVVNDDYKRVFTADKVAIVVLYMVSDLSAPQTGKILFAGGGRVQELRMEAMPRYVPSETFDIEELTHAIGRGEILFPERPFNYLAQ